MYSRKALDLSASAAAATANGPISAAITARNSFSSDLDTRGWLLFKLGQLDKSIDTLRASASLTPRGEVYAHLAQAELKAGHREESATDWREATFLEPGRVAEVPAEIAPSLDSISPISPDRTWYPVKADVAVSLPARQPFYFFVVADTVGKVISVRELDSEDQATKSIVPAVRMIAFTPVQWETRAVPTVHLLRVVKMPDGDVSVSLSVAPEAVALVSDLAPAEFAPPAPAPAPTPSSGDVLRIGGGVTQPRILQKIEPTYAEEARRAKLQGTVELKVVVGADGKTRDIQAAKSLGLGLDEKAIDAVTASVFQPATKTGQPVNVYASINVTFHLLDKASNPPGWHVGRATFQTPEGASRPVVEKIHAPQIAREVADATATVRLEVNEKGTATNFKVEKASDEGWARDVTEALREWKFTPARKNGAPLPVPCTMDFVRGN